MKLDKQMNDFFKKIKEKFPIKVEKNPELLNSVSKSNEAFEALKEDSNEHKKTKKTVKSLFKISIGSQKDSKVRRELKQSEKGIVLIVVGIFLTFFSFNYFYTPQQNKHREVSSLKAESMSNRNEVEAQLAKKDDTKDLIKKLQKKLDSYKSMYPNYRTQNEVLLLLNPILGESVGNLSNITVTYPIPVLKEDISKSITQKGLTSNLKNSSYFAAQPTEDTDTTAPATENSEGTATNTKFEYTEANITISNLGSSSQALEIVKKLHASDRIIVPSSLKIVESSGSYNVEGTLYFYAYRDSKQVENLF